MCCPVRYSALSFLIRAKRHHDRLSVPLARTTVVGGLPPRLPRSNLRLTGSVHTITAEARGALEDHIAVADRAAVLVFCGVSSHPAPKDGHPSKRCRHLSQAARGVPACASHNPAKISSGPGGASDRERFSFA